MRLPLQSASIKAQLTEDCSCGGAHAPTRALEEEDQTPHDVQITGEVITPCIVQRRGQIVTQLHEPLTVKKTHDCQRANWRTLVVVVERWWKKRKGGNGAEVPFHVVAPCPSQSRHQCYPVQPSKSLTHSTNWSTSAASPGSLTGARQSQTITAGAATAAAAASGPWSGPRFRLLSAHNCCTCPRATTMLGEPKRILLIFYDLRRRQRGSPPTSVTSPALERPWLEKITAHSQDRREKLSF